MNAVKTALRELWGLFVDDGSLAVAIVAWCGGAAFAFPYTPLPLEWHGPVFLAGCIAILIANVVRAARA